MIAISSASSKTAYGTAFLLQGKGPELVGLTSPANVEFTESLGCYDRVIAYDRIAGLNSDTPTVYLDVAGSGELRDNLRAHLGDLLVRDVVVGVTHQESGAWRGARPADPVLLRPRPDAQAHRRLGPGRARPELRRRVAHGSCRRSRVGSTW